MTLKNLYLLIALGVLMSCNDEGKKVIEKPVTLIAKDKMVNIIYDMSLISAAKGTNRKLMEVKGINPNQYIYDKFDIDSVQFAQSNEYYAFDVDAYEQIYNNVKAKLQEKKKHYNTLVRAEEKKKDSINKERRKKADSLRERGELSRILPDDKALINSKQIRKNAPRPVKNIDSLKKLTNQ